MLLLISSFSDGLTRLLWEDKWIEHLHVDSVILLSTTFASIQEEECMYILVKTFRGIKMCFFYNV